MQPVLPGAANPQLASTRAAAVAAPSLGILRLASPRSRSGSGGKCADLRDRGAVSQEGNELLERSWLHGRRALVSAVRGCGGDAAGLPNPSGRRIPIIAALLSASTPAERFLPLPRRGPPTLENGAPLAASLRARRSPGSLAARSPCPAASILGGLVPAHQAGHPRPRADALRRMRNQRQRDTELELASAENMAAFRSGRDLRRFGLAKRAAVSAENLASSRAKPGVRLLGLSTAAPFRLIPAARVTTTSRVRCVGRRGRQSGLGSSASAASITAKRLPDRPAQQFGPRVAVGLNLGDDQRTCARSAPRRRPRDRLGQRSWARWLPASGRRPAVLRAESAEPNRAAAATVRRGDRAPAQRDLARWRKASPSAGCWCGGPTKSYRDSAAGPVEPIDPLVGSG